jgi:CubicO group peptidase (beta-lactamase class C family)
VTVTRRAALGALALVALPPSRVGAQGDAVDQVVRAEMDQRHIPAVSLAVARRGAIVKSAAYGLMSVSPSVPAAPATIYTLDSITKQFMASGIMLLVQDGRVQLDAPVKAYVPNAPSSWDAITVRHLLTHTSGLAHDPPAGYPPIAVQNTPPGAMLARLFQMQPLFDPGSRYAYSNSGYSALAAVIQLVTQQPYLRFMRERIFDPVGMANTWLDFMGRLDAARAPGYFWEWTGLSPVAARWIVTPNRPRPLAARWGDFGGSGALPPMSISRAGC